MATLQAKRIKDALAKVRRVGRIEEPVTIAGCEVTLQNLSPTELEDALHEIQDLEDVAYAHAYQMEQICRSIIEIDGQDLRDVDFVEDEVAAGQFVLEVVLANQAAAEALATQLRGQKLSPSIMPTEAGTKTVKLERHHWLRENVLKTWSREALGVTWRKFAEVLIKADAVTKNGVAFLVPDETVEDRYRRLLNDLQETEEELPDEFVAKILDDAGLIKKSRREELEAANERLREVPQEAPQAASAAPRTHPDVPPVVSEPSHEAAVKEADAQQAMASRKRLNEQGGSTIPVPTPPAETIAVSAGPRAKVPDQIRQAAMQNTQGITAVPPGTGIPTRAGRASEIAALEAQVDPAVVDRAVPPPTSRGNSEEIPELAHKAKTIDEQNLRSILDRPPVIGINPKFKPRF